MTSRTSRFATSRSLAGVLLATGALITACESRLPTSAQIAKMDGAVVVRQAGRAALIDTGTVRYVLNGSPITAAAAKTISADQIKGIQIVRGIGKSSDVIRFTTRDDTSSMKTTGEVIRIAPSGATDAPTVAADHKFKGLLVVDGKVVESGDLDAMPPEQINSIEILKASAATNAYSDPRAANGVIKVTTRARP